MIIGVNKKSLKFKIYVRRGRKFLLKKKFINLFLYKLNKFFSKSYIIGKKSHLIHRPVFENTGLHSMYNFLGFYNIWYNKLLIQNNINFYIKHFKSYLIHFCEEENDSYSSELLTEITGSGFLIFTPRKLKFFSREKNIGEEVVVKKKINNFNYGISKTAKKNSGYNHHLDLNFKFVNFHRIFLNIISRIGHQLSFYHDSFYNHTGSITLPIPNDQFSLNVKNAIKDQFLHHLDIVFSFVKNKFLIVNLIDPVLGLNLFSAHPSVARRRIHRLFPKKKQKDEMNKYLFLFNLKKKKALKNKFLRTLTILSASRRLLFIQKTNPRTLNLILNIPRHIIDKTLYYCIAFFIKPYPYIDYEEMCQRLDFSSNYEKFKKMRYNNRNRNRNRRFNFKKNLKEKEGRSSSLILKFLLKYMLFLNFQKLGKRSIFTRKRNIFFFLYIFSFLLRRIRIFVVLMLRHHKSLIKHFFNIYKKRLYILKYLLKLFMISYKLQSPHKDDILNLLKFKTIKERKDKMKTMKQIQILKKLKKMKKYVFKHVFKIKRTFSQTKLDTMTKVHNIIFTSCQSHGSFLKISKNRRL